MQLADGTKCPLMPLCVKRHAYTKLAQMKPVMQKAGRKLFFCLFVLVFSVWLGFFCLFIWVFLFAFFFFFLLLREIIVRYEARQSC